MIKDIERLIIKMIKFHNIYSDSYFSKYSNNDLINLSKTMKDNYPLDYIIKYRLDLHESINDYLIHIIDECECRFVYRVKTIESLLNKISIKYFNSDKYFPINKYLNDIFGFRIVIDKSIYKDILELLERLKSEFKISYIIKDGEYKAIHVYINNNKYYFPWEIQIWENDNIDSNIKSHIKSKRNFNNISINIDVPEKE